MGFNDLKVNFGVFHHAESIYDTFKAIGSSGGQIFRPFDPFLGGPFRYRGPSDPLELNLCLAPQIVDGF